MLRFVTDEDFDNRVLDGLLRRNPNLNVVRVQDIGLSGAHDRDILASAAQEGRILLTHDKRTAKDYAYERVRDGLPMPGVFAVKKDSYFGDVIEEILLFAECSLDDEWEGQVLYIPHLMIKE